MKVSKTKILVCLIWAICAVSLFSSQMFWLTNAQIKKSDDKLDLKPANAMIDSFDASIQQRFLTEPYFGIRRIAPNYPTNPHLEYFDPKTDEETKSLADFESGGWKVFLYLFGRRAKPRVARGKEQKDFTINYRINQPVSITKGLKKEDLPKGESLIKDVKAAFLAFQTPNGANENNYEFRTGKWSYVARPVRAADETCIKCHTDFVITEKLKNNQFKFRKRRVGDANGVLVYGFTRDE